MDAVAMQRLFREPEDTRHVPESPANCLGPPFIGPIYVWRDRHFNLHLLTCKSKRVSRCQCLEELKRITFRNAPFLLILVHRMKTYLMYMCHRFRQCENSCQFGGQSNYQNHLNITATLHYGDCEGVCKCRISSNFSYSIPLWSDYNTVTATFIREQFDLLHLPNCNGTSCCYCTKTLLERGFYKIRVQLYGNHLTCQPVTDQTDHWIMLLEQYPLKYWSRLERYDFPQLKTAMDDSLKWHELDMEQGYSVYENPTPEDDGFW